MSELEQLQAEYLGLFAVHLGIKPWEWDYLTPEQAYSLKGFVDQIEKAKG